MEGRQIFWHYEEGQKRSAFALVAWLEAFVEELYSYLKRLRPLIWPDRPYKHGDVQDRKPAPKNKALCVRIISEFEPQLQAFVAQHGRFIQPLKKHATVSLSMLKLCWLRLLLMRLCARV